MNFPLLAESLASPSGVVSYFPQILIAILGGLVASIVTVTWSARAQARQRQIELLRDQLRNLYGPLHFFAKQNQELVNVQSQHDEAYKKEFIEKKYTGVWPKDESGKTEPEKAIDVMNEYAELIRKNNASMMRVLQEHWSLIDDDDCEMLARFQVDCKRSEIEFDEKRMPKIHFFLFEHVGNVITYRSEFVQRIDQKWQTKQRELRRMLRDYGIFPDERTHG